MAVNFTTLFTRIGRIGHLNYVANVHQAALPGTFDGLFDQFTSQPDRQWVLPLNDAYDSLLLAPIAGLDTGTTAAQRILFEMIKADNPAAATSIPSAVQELIRQMVVASESVSTCAIASTAAVLGTQVGNGSIITSKFRGDGLIRQNVIAETASVVCEVDSYSGGATAGQEQFRFTGASQVTNRLSYDWPGGSGASFPFFAISATSAASQTGNLLTNSTFETFTVANTPDNWAVEAGAPGTQILSNSTTPYFGTKNIRYVGNATAAAISQTFNVSTGTIPVPRPEINMAIFVAVRINTVPAAGNLRFELTDSANGAITDQAGGSNVLNVNLTGLVNATWTLVTANFRFPRAVVSGAKLRARLSTALSVGSTVDFQLAFAEMQTPYAGGPSVAVFGGSIPFARADTWTVADTNDRASALYLATWNGFMDRLFQLRENGLQLPYSGSPTQADSLISS